MKRMQHCFWCGEALGVYHHEHGDIEHCSDPECARQARYVMLEQESEARHRAEDDHYERYRS